MTYTVTVTPQGQISIPIQLRRKLSLDKAQVNISEENGKLILEPIEDLLNLKGVFETHKKIPMKKIRQSFETYLANEAIKGLK